MAEDLQEFQTLMDRLRGRDPEAARELLRVYGPYILRVIRRRLHQKLRGKFDSTDFEQSVWGSFFALPLDQLTFDTPEALVVYLASMASNKVVDAVRLRMMGHKKNVNHERSLDGSAAAEAQHLADPSPSPSQKVMAEERFDKLHRNVPTRPGQRILVMLRQGYSQREIARILGISCKMVQRLIRNLDTGP